MNQPVSRQIQHVLPPSETNIGVTTSVVTEATEIFSFLSYKTFEKVPDFADEAQADTEVEENKKKLNHRYLPSEGVPKLNFDTPLA